MINNININNINNMNNKMNINMDKKKAESSY